MKTEDALAELAVPARVGGVARTFAAIVADIHEQLPKLSERRRKKVEEALFGRVAVRLWHPLAMSFLNAHRAWDMDVQPHEDQTAQDVVETATMMWTEAGYPLFAETPTLGGAATDADVFAYVLDRGLIECPAMAPQVARALLAQRDELGKGVDIVALRRLVNTWRARGRTEQLPGIGAYDECADQLEEAFGAEEQASASPLLDSIMEQIGYREEQGLSITRLVIGRAELNDLRVEIRNHPALTDETIGEGWFLGMRLVVAPDGFSVAPQVRGTSGTFEPAAWSGAG